MQQRKIAFIGGGNMAQAIALGLVKKGYPAELITVSDPNTEKLALFSSQGIQISTQNIDACQQADVVLLAVKPQVIAGVCEALSAVDFSQKLVISIAAAISSQKLTALLPSATQIIRVMPNTPALVSEGMAGLFAEECVDNENKAFAQDLMSAVGKMVWVNNEQDMHLITAASGSSPAYFFLFMEAMQQTLLAQGIDENTARQLVQQSALGAAKMVSDNPDLDLPTLRQNVTSKGGTTAAAITVFEQQQLAKTVQLAMQACIERSKEMERLF